VTAPIILAELLEPLQARQVTRDRAFAEHPRAVRQQGARAYRQTRRHLDQPTYAESRA
jgi:hypothetical protein